MKKFIISFAALAVVTLGIYGVSNAAVFDDKGKITAEASESKSIAPDTATITFSVETSDKNSQKAVELNNQRMAAIADAVKKQLAANESVKTSSYNLRQKYEYNNITKKDVQTGYIVTNTITVTLKDTKKAAKIIDTATQNGATNVSGLSFTIQNTDSVCRELTTKATQKAKKEAETVLAALGKTIDSVVSVNYSCNSQFHNSPRMYMSMKRAGNGADEALSGVTIEEGENKVTAYVTIVFTIK